MSEVWSFGRIAAALGEAVEPAEPALIHGDTIVDWGQFDHDTDALAAAFLAAGAAPGDKVAHLLRNSPAYLTTVFATFKARMVHVNVNYRYTGDELLYIFDNSDAAVIVYDAEFAPLVAELQPRLAKAKLFVEVGDNVQPFARSLTALCAADDTPDAGAHRGDDMLFIYTGGTTGYPKGVMWDQEVIWTMLGGGAAALGGAPATSLAEHLAGIRAGQGRRRMLVLPPLMHGSGFLMGIYTLACGGSVVTLPGHSFDPAEAIAACERYRPTNAVIVGDAFARPLLRALDERGGDITSLQVMISSGTMWSPEAKAGLLRHHPGLVLIDSLGSSESLGMGAAVQSAANAGAPTRFMHDPNTIVVDDQLRPVAPGTMGRIARGGLLPRGYYKDDAKTAATFVIIDGQRYSMAGDHAVLEADGSMTLMGRGNQCINTGGEKVFPEEVEEALKTHPAVEDALVFGVADEKWGQAVTAVVECSGEALADDIVAHVRRQLAAYKAPKAVHIVGKVPRAPNGKADYAGARALLAGPAT
jgi:fatty-acyl-CoA synthase